MTLKEKKNAWNFYVVEEKNLALHFNIYNSSRKNDDNLLEIRLEMQSNG
jgi:hypothetical protein